MSSAILITYDRDDAINEALGLCESAGYDVLHVIRQKFLKKPKYGIGAGALEKLEELSDDLDPDIIIFDELLKPTQNYNLASTLNKFVLDRESLILEIFEHRASSKESLLQIKLAKLKYELVRAKEKVNLIRKGEKPGFGGIGAYDADTYANDIKRKAQTVQSKLLKAGNQRRLHREGRKKQGFKTISLAGYTSSGKTTLFNTLTGESAEQSKKLFTTLSTTTRRMTINREAFLLSDTVGFIGKLPAYMIDAFKSTLEELLYTNAVIVVADAGDSLFEFERKLRSCVRTLGDLGVERGKIIFILNKMDLASDDQLDEEMEILESQGFDKIMAISAKTGMNIEKLKQLIKRTLNN